MMQKEIISHKIDKPENWNFKKEAYPAKYYNYNRKTKNKCEAFDKW